MKWKHWKTISFMVLIGVTVCIAAYAGRHERGKNSLPAAVKTAIQALYPEAVIEEVEVEREGLKLYEVELEQDNGQEVEVTVSSDGTIVEVETEVAMGSIPQVVAEAIAQVSEGAKIKEIEKEVTYAVVRLVNLDTPRITYEAELIKDGKKSEIKVAADGTVLELKTENDDDDYGDDDDDDN